MEVEILNSAKDLKHSLVLLTHAKKQEAFSL
jgi:hypothetical protein